MNMENIGGALLSSLWQLDHFLDQGGQVLWSIVAVSCLLWFMICERYYFFFWQYPRLRQHLQHTWFSRTEHTSWAAHRIRAGLLGEAREQLHQYVCILQVLPQILLFLGLLGTVSGMINVFDMLSYFGAEPRSLAAGISQALLTTMGGLLTALPGLYFSHAIHHYADQESQTLADILTFD